MGVKYPFSIVLTGMLLVGLLSDLAGQGLPSPLVRKYQRDAARLTLRLSGSDDELRYASVTLPNREVTRIFEMLKAAYEQVPAVQNLSKCHIHTSAFPPIDQLQVIYRKDAPWARSLNQGMMQIDHPAINELLTSYNLVIDRVNRWTENENALTIRARKPMNILALGNEFQSIQGVTGVDVREGLLQANDIEIAPTAKGYVFRYILRFNGLSSGEHFWQVEVTHQLKASLIREGGDPIPEWLRCLLEAPAPVSTW